MKEKTKAFYKTVFKYWIKETLIPTAITLFLMFIIGYVFYRTKWDMGYTALMILTWREVKKVWSDRK